MRPATQEDAAFLYELRNHPKVRDVSNSTAEIIWEDHVAWLVDAITSGRQKIYIGMDHGEKVGVVRFTVDDDGPSIVSLTVAPSHHGRGIGKTILSQGIDQFKEISGNDILATIRNDNFASIACFKANRFSLAEKGNDFSNYILRKPILKHKLDSKISFRQITQTEEDSRVLYEFLAQRETSISHKAMPSWESHLDFVQNNPYRHWAFIEFEARLVGTIYVQNDNSIGISWPMGTADHYAAVIQSIISNFSPLPPIKSIRPDNFTINVAPDNKLLSQALLEMDCVLLQTTYELPQVQTP